MKIKIEKSPKLQKGLLVVPVTTENLKNCKYKEKGICELLEKISNQGVFKAKLSQTESTFIEEASVLQQVLFVGMGDNAKLNDKAMRALGGVAGKYAKSKKAEEVSIILDSTMVTFVRAIVESFLEGQYDSGKLKAKRKKDDMYELKTLTIITDSKSKTIESDIKSAEISAESHEYVKDLVNFPSNIVDAEYIARESREIAKENKYKIVVLTEKELKKMGWGGLLSVNQGGSKQAMCVVLQYDGAKSKKEKPIVIVGKGMIFDTGGYNMKPTKGIETMHQDMAGGATVLGVFNSLKKLKIEKNVIGIVPLGENLVSDTAYRPSDIITMFSGDTVEITNTDAEGRLILADAITYATKLAPQEIITIATLTGAVKVATGERYCGLIGNDDTLRSALQRAGDAVDDLGWPLPLDEDYRACIKSDLADMKNYDDKNGSSAGSSRAAAFLDAFTEKNKWCHIDIGGTGFTGTPKPYQTMGATAHGFRMLINYLEN